MVYSISNLRILYFAFTFKGIYLLLSQVILVWITSAGSLYYRIVEDYAKANVDSPGPLTLGPNEAFPTSGILAPAWLLPLRFSSQ